MKQFLYYDTKVLFKTLIEYDLNHILTNLSEFIISLILKCLASSIHPRMDLRNQELFQYLNEFPQFYLIALELPLSEFR